MRLYSCLLLFLFALVPCSAWMSSSEVARKELQHVGIDLGTSGARISVIQAKEGHNRETESTLVSYGEIYSQSVAWNLENGSYDDADAWMTAIARLLDGAKESLGDLNHVRSICISGTSASCLVVDRHSLEVTRSPRMYNYDILTAATEEAASAGTDSSVVAAKKAIELINSHAPPKHTARARTGSLAKLVAWSLQSPLQEAEVLCHQSDFCSTKLLADACPVKSDWHNCLKLGYDIREKKWPGWLLACLEEAGVRSPTENCGSIPLEVVAPGLPLGTIDSKVAISLGLPQDTIVVGGTTDSNAAFFAAAGTSPTYGTAVTSLGSTLAMKQLSQTYVEDADLGVYSHRFPNFDDIEAEAWLVGGASNVGCAILRKLGYSDSELVELSSGIDPNTDSPLDYYPLTKVGERFPISDPDKVPVLDPVPEDRQEYLHGILQSIAKVECEGFSKLTRLGAPTPSQVWTCGGGSKNAMWTKMRERLLLEQFPTSDIRVQEAACTEASFGAALLAAASFKE